MPDPRFYPLPDPIPVADLAGDLNLEIRGGGDLLITGVAPLDLARSGDLAFVAARKNLSEADLSKASAFVVPEGLVAAMPDNAILVISPAPQRDFARIARRLFPEDRSHFAEIPVHPDAVLGQNVSVSPGVVIGAGADIGSGSEIGPNAVIGPGVVLGQGCRIGANVSLSHAILGDRVRILPGAAIGQDGFGYVEGESGLEPIPQLGRVMIGDDVDIGSNTTIDRGAGGDTVIGSGTKVDNQVQIGHNCKIGAHCVLVAHAGISGSVTIGNFVQIGGKVGIADHITIGDGAKVAAGSGVIKDIGPGETHGGYPAQPVRAWHRQTLALSRMAKPSSPKK